MLVSERSEIIDRHQESLPVDVVALAKDMGATVYRANNWPLNASGMIKVDQKVGGHEGFVIYVNAQHHVNRRRFTIAHEIAHIMLHRDLIGNGITTDGLYRSGLGSGVERAANRVAGNILMPWSWINRLIDDGVTSVNALARQFQVSHDAMVIQLSYHWVLDWDDPPNGQ